MLDSRTNCQWAGLDLFSTCHGFAFGCTTNSHAPTLPLSLPQVNPWLWMGTAPTGRKDPDSSHYRAVSDQSMRHVGQKEARPPVTAAELSNGGRSILRHWAPLTIETHQCSGHLDKLDHPTVLVAALCVDMAPSGWRLAAIFFLCHQAIHYSACPWWSPFRWLAWSHLPPVRQGWSGVPKMLLCYAGTTVRNRVWKWKLG